MTNAEDVIIITSKYTLEEAVKNGLPLFNIGNTVYTYTDQETLLTGTGFKHDVMTPEAVSGTFPYPPKRMFPR